MRFLPRRSAVIWIALQLVAKTTVCAQTKVGDPIPVFRAGALSFSFPSPSDDLVETGSDYRVLLEPFAPIANRLVAAFIPLEQMSVIRDGKVPRPKQYALVEVMRGLEFRDIDSEHFKLIAESVGKQFEADSNLSLQTGEEELNRKLKALGSADSVTLEKPVPLGTFFIKPNASGFGIISPASTNEGTLKMATAVNVMRLHNRLVFTYLYSVYKDESTLLWLRTTSERWVDALLKANQ